MAGPWEKYAAQSSDGEGPWLKYAAPQAGQPEDGQATAGTVVATTEDGGRVIKGDDGSLSFTSPGYATNDPAKIAEIMKGAKPADVSMGGWDQQTIAQAPVGARAGKFVQGIPFVGQYADEAIGALSGDGAMRGARALQSAMDRQHPVESVALQTAGGIVGSAPVIAAAAPSVIAAAPETLLGRASLGMGAGMVTGGLEGAVSGFGAGNEGNRLDSAAQGAATGAVLGGLFGGAAPLGSAALAKAFRWAKGQDVATIAKTFGISRKAAEAIKPDIEALDFASAARNLQIAGRDAMVADAGQPLREALDAAITGGGKAARIGTDAVSERAARAGIRLGNVMDSILGAPKGVKGSARSIAERTAPLRKKAYDMAYGTAIDYSSDAGRNIEAVLGRVPGKTLSAAISEANDAMQAAGIKNMQIMAQIGEDGAVTFREMPNVQQLDEIKKALGSVAADQVDQFGRPTAAGLRARGLAFDLKSAISDAVPAYKTATKLGGDKLAEDRALALGRKLFNPSTTREDVADWVRAASTSTNASKNSIVPFGKTFVLDEHDAIKHGIRSYIDDTLARVRRSIDDPSVDTQETRRLLDTLTTRDAREKLSMVLGQQKAGRLFSEIDAAGKQFATRQAIATGSATGRREARSRALDNVLAPGVVGNAAKGNAWPTIHSLIQMVTRATPQADLAVRQNVLAEVATALTQKRGPDAEAALSIIQKAIQGQPVKTEEAARLARLLASSGALAGYQSGQQYLQGPGTAR